jgi:CheY-like chemotaxis protein
MNAAKKIILAEDDPDDRQLFSIFYEHRRDIRLLPSVGNGHELVHYLEAIVKKNLPDLIILDQNMPLMNGKQTLRFLKSDPRFSKIPAVIYSTYTDSSLILECTKLGANMVAVKPIDREGYQKMMDDFMVLLGHNSRN